MLLRAKTKTIKRLFCLEYSHPFFLGGGGRGGYSIDDVNPLVGIQQPAWFHSLLPFPYHE